MAAIGDSVSSGTLAQYHRSRAPNPLVHAQLLLEFIRFGFRGGDKLSLSDRAYSWTTGLGSRKVLSHAGRLRQLNPSLKVANFAEPGAKIAAVWTSQLPQLKAATQRSLGQNYPDYVTLLVGANDVCGETLAHLTPAQAYLRSYRKILQEILRESPESKVLAVALPPYVDIRNSADALLFGLPGLSRCQSIWKLAPLCPNITSEDPRAQWGTKKHIQQLNRGIQGLVSELRQQYGDRVRFAEKTAKRRITPQDLSIDCFHPNDAAQNDLASLSWQSTWWARD